MNWFTSDWHLGHDNIIRYCNRPFSSVQHMNENLVSVFNFHVAPDDHVYFLGDMVMGKVAKNLSYIERLNGTKFLIPGNHDKVWEGRSHYFKHLDAYEDAGFNILPGQMIMRFPQSEVLLCHFPYEGDSGDEDRFPEYRPVNAGLPLLCGHVHEKWQKRDQMFNVGVDVNGYAPVSGAEIEAWIEGLQV